MAITINEFKDWVLANPELVRTSVAPNGYMVLKYQRCVHYDNLWNEQLAECRGVVIDPTDGNWTIASLPFEKIYNFRKETNAPAIDDNEVVTAVRKVNGFMAAATVHKGELLLSTTGSVTSDYVAFIKRSISSVEQWTRVLSEIPGRTALFECVHPLDPHIVPEVAGMYLLGLRDKEFGSPVEVNSPLTYEIGARLGCFIPETRRVTVGQLMSERAAAKHEGWVLYTDDGVSTKIKTPYYLACKAIARKGDILSLNKQRVDEEFYPLLEHLQSIKDTFNAWTEQTRLTYIRNWLEQS